MQQDVLGRVSAGQDLTMAEMTEVINSIMQGQWAEEQIGLLLTALRAKGETVQEIAGAAQAMRVNMTRIRSSREGLLDTCGTGGDNSGTFNISTAAAIVTAAAGVPVAKHGNRSITSKTGSADVLAELGVNIEATVQQSEACLDEVGICFCFAPLMHQSMKHVGPVRKKLGVPTIFNLLGPLCNPAGAAFQLLGVGKHNIRRPLAEALGLLEIQRAVVVCGEDGLDEVTLCGPTACTETTPDAVREFSWSPEQFGIPAATDKSAMLVNSPAESADMITSILNATPGPPRDIVVLNAAAALWTARKESDLRKCALLAQEAIDGGAAKKVLQDLVRVSSR